MSPMPAAPGLSPDTFLLLRYLLTATLLLYLPFLGVVIAGSAASLFLNFSGSDRRDPASLRLSRDWIEAVTLRPWVLFLAGLLPYPALVLVCRGILGSRDTLPPAAWLVPFGALLAGCALLSFYRSVVLRNAEPSPLIAGSAGLLSMVTGSFLLFLLLGTLSMPSKLPLIGVEIVYILSWNPVAGFLLFLAMSFGLAGGIALRLLDKGDPAGGGRTPDYVARVRSAGSASVLAGALAVPALIVLFLISFPATGLSTEVFVMAATVPILALAVFALLLLFPGKGEGGAGDRVTSLFVLMFLAVILCYQVAVANAFQGLSAPPGPLAAADAAKTVKPAAKPAGGDAAVLEKGKKVFDTVCAVCHRFDAKVIGPPLNEVVPTFKGDLAKLKKFIRDPVKVNPAYPAMPKPAIKEDEVDAVARYLMSKVKGGK